MVAKERGFYGAELLLKSLNLLCVSGRYADASSHDSAEKSDTKATDLELL